MRYFKELAFSFGYNYGETAQQPRIWFIENTAFYAFRAGFSVAGDAVLDPTIENHKHSVQIHGTDIQTNSNLINMFNRLLALGVSATYHNE